MTRDDLTSDRLRTALTAVADRHEPDAEAWHHIENQVSGRGPALVAADRHGPAAPRRRHRLLAAAVIAAVAAVATVAVLARGDHDRDTTDVTTTPAVATGWYIPVGLPDGWTVREVTAQRMDERCPCSETTWASPSRDIVLIRSTDPDRAGQDGVTEVPSPSTSTFAVADDVEGTITPAPDAEGGPTGWTAGWVVDGERTSLTAIGIAPSQAAEVARAVFADPTSVPEHVEGVAPVGSWSETSPVNRDADVGIAMASPAGHEVDITLSSSDRWRSKGILVPTDRLAGQQPLALLTLKSYAPTPVGDQPRVRDYIGLWPGATVRVLGGYADGPATDAEIDAVTASLRPATLDEWRAFVAGAENRDRAATSSATLQDLIDGRAAPTASVAARGDLDDLDVTLDATPRMATWEDAGVSLTVRNPTSSAITDPTCALDRAEVALLPADDQTQAAVDAIPAGDPWWQDDGPCDGGTTMAPGASKTIRLPVRAQFHDARYGPLPGGRYGATVRIDGVTGQVTTPVEIGADPACTGDTAGYVGLTEVDARALAEQRGVTEVRTPAAGTESDVVTYRCDRLTLVVDDGRVTFARFY